MQGRTGAKKAEEGNKNWGKPGTAGKADGGAAVEAYLAGVAQAQEDLVRRLDQILTGAIPDCAKAIKWSMPFYGHKEVGWIATLGAFKAHVRVSFFAGAAMDDGPPEGDSKGMRGMKYRTLEDVDEVALKRWIAQGLRLKGWGSVS